MAMPQAGVQVETRPAEELLTVSAAELSNLKLCSKKFELGRVGITYPGSDVRNFLWESLELLKRVGVSAYPDALAKHLSTFQSSWFHSRLECDAERETAEKKLLRLADYLADKEVVNTNVYVQRPFSPPIRYRGCIISTLTAKLDFVIKNPDGSFTGVILKQSEPKESARARKTANLPENSVELLAAYIASHQFFKGSRYHIEKWHLKNKDDSGTRIMEKFEHRPGKNIVTYDFSVWSVEENFNRLVHLLSCTEEKPCDSCRHKEVCQMPTELRAKTVSNTEKTHATASKNTFTDIQQEAINHLDGPLCCIAVPGAGKTTCLVQRLLKLVEEHHVKPSRILLVTFTQKAATEIEERVQREFSSRHIKGMPVVSTYHGLGFSILKENPMYLGNRLRLATEIDRYHLIHEACTVSPKIEGFCYRSPFGEYGIVKVLDKYFEELQLFGEDIFRKRYEAKDVEGILTVYRTYQELYAKNGYISFDDQISLVNDLFEEHPVLSHRYADKYQYIMLDEFQDTNEEQMEMVYAIARHHENIVVVGDDDQSIYQWRGGTSQYMLDFNQDWPQGKILYMTDNFRSRQPILDAANALFQTGAGRRYAKELVSADKSGGKPWFIKYATEQTLKNLVRKCIQTYKPGEIAVLARNNKHLEECEELLQDVCKVSSPKDYLIKDTLFLTIFDCLELYFRDCATDPALYRTFARMGEQWLLKKTDRKKTLYENLLIQLDLTKDEVMSASLKQLAELSHTLAKLNECFCMITTGQLKEVLTCIANAFFGVADHPVIEALTQLADERGIVSVKDMYELMTQLILFDAQNRVGYEVDEEAVNLLTCHDAKGREFPVVIIYSMEDFNCMEEEVRVLYVAMTRAKSELYLLEGAYNTYEDFDKIAPYVEVHGGDLL